jgi:hypothetical protein
MRQAVCRAIAGAVAHRDKPAANRLQGGRASMIVVMTAPTELAELLARATDRRPLGQTDGKSGSIIERLVIDGERYVLKTMHPDLDWIARVLGDLCCWPALMVTSGLRDQIPSVIDDTVVAAVAGQGRNAWGGTLLMRDVSPWLVPEGDEVVPLDHHLDFIDHMAALHARFWEFEDTVGLLPLSGRYQFFGRGMLEVERARGFDALVPRLAAEGWDRLRTVDHPAAGGVLDLVADPTPLVKALAASPQTFVQGDWKMGNLGRHPDGRTILLDWAYPGRGPATYELAWYLGINSARLPQTKEATIAAYRSALERHGVGTDGWFDDQLALALLGEAVILGWEKALGGGAELDWWLERAEEGLTRL